MSSDHGHGLALNQWVALGIEVAGVAVASLCALMTLSPTFVLEGTADVVASSFIYVIPAAVTVNYAGQQLPVEQEGHQVEVVYIDAPDGHRALSVTFNPNRPDSATYITRDARDYQQKKGVAGWARLGLLAGLITAAAAAIVVVVHGLRRHAVAVAIAAAAAPWTLIGGVPPIVNLASLPVDLTVKAPAVDIWLGTAALTLVASVVSRLRHEPGARVLVGAIVVAVTATIAWCAGWAITFLNGLNGLVPRA